LVINKEDIESLLNEKSFYPGGQCKLVEEIKIQIYPVRAKMSVEKCTYLDAEGTQPGFRTYGAEINKTLLSTDILLRTEHDFHRLLN
jgi:hypothetical protein